MSGPRQLKKYPNRRLYDPVESRYITLPDVRKLVIDCVDFVVVDYKTRADITHSILLQVLVDQEEQEERPLMSLDFLSQVIRLYGDPTRGTVTSYLQQSLEHFVNQQRDTRSLPKSAGHAASAEAMSNVG